MQFRKALMLAGKQNVAVIAVWYIVRLHSSQSSDRLRWYYRRPDGSL